MQLKHGSAKNLTGMFFSQKNYDRNVFAFPLLIQLDAALQARAVLHANVSQFSQFPDHRSVLQGFAGVFPGLHIGMQIGFRHRQPNFPLFSAIYG